METTQLLETLTWSRYGCLSVTLLRVLRYGSQNFTSLCVDAMAIATPRNAAFSSWVRHMHHNGVLYSVCQLL